MFDWVQFQFPSRVFLERGSSHKLGTIVKDIGSRVMVLVIQDELQNEDELAIIKTSLERYTTGCIMYEDITGRPTLDEIDTAAHFAKRSRANVILAYGSRNSFNTARVISLLANNELFSSELPSKPFPLKKDPVPTVMVPASFTMGEESSPNITLYDRESDLLFFARDPRLYPAAIFMDPNITTPVAETEMIRTGISAMAAAVESILAKKANDISNSMALKSMDLVVKNLGSLVRDSNNHAARTNLMMSSLLCGMAHSNSSLGLSYSIATATHLMTGIDFQLAMAILLPHVMEYNLTTSAGKYVQIARALEESIHDITVIEAAIKAVEGVRKLYLDLKVPQRLSDFEIEKSALPEIASMAVRHPLIKNTPRELDQNEIETILIASY